MSIYGLFLERNEKFQEKAKQYQVGCKCLLRSLFTFWTYQNLIKVQGPIFGSYVGKVKDKMGTEVVVGIKCYRNGLPACAIYFW